MSYPEDRLHSSWLERPPLCVYSGVCVESSAQLSGQTLIHSSESTLCYSISLVFHDADHVFEWFKRFGVVSCRATCHHREKIMASSENGKGQLNEGGGGVTYRNATQKLLTYC